MAFKNRCCRDWSVFKNNSTGNFSVGRNPQPIGQANLSWVAGPMCCEDAFNAAFTTVGAIRDCRNVQMSITGVTLTLQPNNTFAAIGGGGGGGGGGGIEFNTDRPGQDFTHFALSSADPALCEQACGQAPNCRAWTFVKPNTTQGPNPICWLKTGIPNAVSNTCCVSGVKGMAQAGGGGGRHCPPGTIELLGVCSAPGPSAR